MMPKGFECYLRPDRLLNLMAVHQNKRVGSWFPGETALHGLVADVGA